MVVFPYTAESISLLDEKGKAIVKIPDISSMDEATSHFTDRATYILLKSESEEQKIVSIKKYIRNFICLA